MEHVLADLSRRCNQYNYTLSAALDVGTIVCGIFIFLTLGLPKVSLNWIGTSTTRHTGRADDQADLWFDRQYDLSKYGGLERASLLTPPPTGFGPDSVRGPGQQSHGTHVQLPIEFLSFRALSLPWPSSFVEHTILFTVASSCHCTSRQNRLYSSTNSWISLVH